jgi:predicted  nucleic acid-binding Zn-ribbon protein
VSDHERPEIAAFKELETLVRRMGEELATFRRRALQAEAQLQAVAARGTSLGDLQRLEQLESENAALRKRMASVAGRAQAMLERVRFLRQQHEQGAVGVTGGERR